LQFPRTQVIHKHKAEAFGPLKSFATRVPQAVNRPKAKIDRVRQQCRKREWGLCMPERVMRSAVAMIDLLCAVGAHAAATNAAITPVSFELCGAALCQRQPEYVVA